MFNRIDEHDIEDFDRFSQGLMVGDELTQFKDRLVNDQELRDKYKLYKLLLDKVEANAATNDMLRIRFNRLNKHRLFTFKRFVWLAAASVLLLIVASKLFFSTSPNYKTYLFEEPGLSIEMGKSNTNKWSDFNAVFAEKKYENCISVLKSSLPNDTAVYYTGFCYEMLNRTDSAIVYYLRLKPSENALFKAKGNYRASILLLIQNKIEAGKELLVPIADDPTNPYCKKAKEMLKKING